MLGPRVPLYNILDTTVTVDKIRSSPDDHTVTLDLLYTALHEIYVSCACSCSSCTLRNPAAPHMPNLIYYSRLYRNPLSYCQYQIRPIDFADENSQ